MTESPISTAQFTFAGILGYACTIPGTVLDFLILVAFGIVACFPRARKRLDRVSFRLLVYTLIWNVLYGIAFSVTAAQTGPGPTCNFGAWAVNFTFHLSTYFTTCIALNLQLVLVHGFNGKTLEKYYIIGTFLIAFLLTVPAYGLHQFGWEPSSEVCWWKNPDPAIRLRWLIGAQSFWTLFAATVEIVCSIVVLTWMYLFHFTTSMYIKKASENSQPSGKSFGASTTMVGGMSTSSRGTVIRQASKYRGVILRISLYPIVSLVMNYPIAILDLYTTIVGVNTQLQFRLLALDLILYGLRTFVYAFLAATDPSFISAIREIRGGEKYSTYVAGGAVSYPQFASAPKTDTMQGQMTISMELEQVSRTESAPDRKGDGLLYPHGADDAGARTSSVENAGNIQHNKGEWTDEEEERLFQRQL